MRYPALIFDFDGTIADTLTEGLRIYNELAADNGLVPVAKEDIPELRNLDTKHLLRHLRISKRKLPLLLSKGRRMLKSSIRSLPLVPGMAEVLPCLRQHANCFGILTSNAPENVMEFLEAHGIRDLFTFTSSTPKLSGKSKHLRAIAKTFSLELSDMLYVGDEIRDVRASNKAHIPCAAVTWGLNSRDSLFSAKPRHLVEVPAQLLEVCGIAEEFPGISQP
ncbi:MAG: HAD hydrolase-like protein [Akkermansiaceae bacterium]|nr:HAD hydrolase-like protein [Akkermansiaceae bacterium]